MPLKLNHTYSRQEISESLGGSIQAYLPFKNGRVTCGCFRLEEEYNPGAPDEVMFGREISMPNVEKAAEMVYEQGERGEAIPIFIFHETAKWEYIGDYKCVGLLRDAALLRQKMQEHPRRGVMVGILRFEKA